MNINSECPELSLKQIKLDSANEEEIDFRLLADIVGTSVYPSDNTFGYKKWKGQRRDCSIFQLSYKTDWSQLMPVIESIEEHGAVIINGKHVEITPRIYDITIDALRSYPSIKVFGPTKILAAYSACVEFCKWRKKHYKIK